MEPGTHRDYSNIAAGLAGHIVELAVGEKLNTYAKRRIFTPLRMTNTGWTLAEIDRPKHATLYVTQHGVSPIPLYEGTTYPDGGVRTSVSLEHFAVRRRFACLLRHLSRALEARRSIEK